MNGSLSRTAPNNSFEPTPHRDGLTQTLAGINSTFQKAGEIIAASKLKNENENMDYSIKLTTPP
jgi:hypothetical protein